MEEKVKKPRAPRKTKTTKTTESVVIQATPAQPAVKSAPKTNLLQMRATHEQIAALAHRLWQERGQQHGHDAEDWLRAERMLLDKAS